MKFSISYLNNVNYDFNEIVMNRFIEMIRFKKK